MNGQVRRNSNNFRTGETGMILAARGRGRGTAALPGDMRQLHSSERRISLSGDEGYGR